MAEDAGLYEVPKPVFINGMVLEITQGKDSPIPIQYQGDDGLRYVLEIAPVDVMALSMYLSIE